MIAAASVASAAFAYAIAIGIAGGGSPVAASTTLDVVVIPDGAGAPAVVVVIEDGARRTLSWAAGSSSGALSDVQAGRPFSTLPSTPKGSSATAEHGTISITVDDADGGKWADPYRALAAAAPKRAVLARAAPAMPVPSSKALRIVVDEATATAVVYGDGVRIPGRAVVRRDAPAVRAVVVAGKDVVVGDGAAVDLVSACGRTVPSTVSVVSSSSLKLSAAGAAVCAGPIAVVPVTGTKLDAKKDVVAAGVVVAR